MGFSLEMFFDELQQLLSLVNCTQGHERQQFIEATIKYVEESRKYAEDCGRL